MTDDERLIAKVKQLEEACNEARTALAGMSSVSRAIDILDNRPLGVSGSLRSRLDGRNEKAKWL